MARYRHYQNRGGPNDTIFATTTALDFAHVLRRPEMKTLMVEIIVDIHKRYHATLHAYVVMNNHFHLVSGGL
jgi:REP element-mobilizing transposase RayT